MSRYGTSAPIPPPDRRFLAGGSLRSCRERLRAAVRRLSLNDPCRRDFQAAEQAYDDLVLDISHEVKTSLTVIRGHAQLAARAIRRGEEVDRDALIRTLEAIDASVARISRELDGRIDGAAPPPE